MGPPYGHRVSDPYEDFDGIFAVQHVYLRAD